MYYDSISKEKEKTYRDYAIEYFESGLFKMSADLAIQFKKLADYDAEHPTTEHEQKLATLKLELPAAESHKKADRKKTKEVEERINNVLFLMSTISVSRKAIIERIRSINIAYLDHIQQLEAIRNWSFPMLRAFIPDGLTLDGTVYATNDDGLVMNGKNNDLTVKISPSSKENKESKESKKK